MFINIMSYTKGIIIHLFEGVCETHVILTPGACGRGVRAALHDTTSVGPAGPAGKYTKADF